MKHQSRHLKLFKMDLFVFSTANCFGCKHALHFVFAGTDSNGGALYPGCGGAKMAPLLTELEL